MAYRVVQWGTGAIGSYTLRQIITNPEFDLAGVFVYSDAKNGVDAGDLVGLPPTGITATTNRDDILALDADVVVHTPRGHGTMDRHDADVIALLASGKNIVSTVGYASPLAHGVEYAGRLEAAGLAGGATLCGTGVDPEFVLSRIPASMTALCTDVSHLYVSEIADLAVGSSIETLQDIAGIGQDPVDYTPNMEGAQYFLWYMPEVADRLARNLGVDPEGSQEEFEILFATRDFEIPGIEIKTGAIVGARYQRRTAWRGKEFIHLDWYLTVQRDLPSFPPLAEGADARWTIAIEGTPSMRVVWDSYHSLTDQELNRKATLASWSNPTGTMALRAIPSVVAAKPGLYEIPVGMAWNAQSW
jgi:2,4-diaminopentanoate dehydrogenase